MFILPHINILRRLFVLQLPVYLWPSCDSWNCRGNIRRKFDNSPPRQLTPFLRRSLALAYVCTDYFMIQHLDFALDQTRLLSIASAASFAARAMISSSSPSVITRIRGSVPDGRTTIRPPVPRSTFASSIACFTAVSV